MKILNGIYAIFIVIAQNSIPSQKRFYFKDEKFLNDKRILGIEPECYQFPISIDNTTDILAELELNNFRITLVDKKGNEFVSQVSLRSFLQNSNSLQATKETFFKSLDGKNGREIDFSKSFIEYLPTTDLINNGAKNRMFILKTYY
jgi:hypothetical protein